MLINKNILYNPELDIVFNDYGIQIPIVANRAQKVFDELKLLIPDLEYIELDDLPKISNDDLLRVHDIDFINRLLRDEKTLEFELMSTYELVDSDGNYFRFDPNNSKFKLSKIFEKIQLQIASTYLSMNQAIELGFSYFLGGGMHHSMSFGGRGFCLLNDIVIGLRKLQFEEKIKTAWVIDVDAHKGDGTAQITSRDNTIITLSIHMKEGWPLNSGTVRDPWFIPSNLEIGIDQNEENEYLTKLENSLNEMKNQFPLPDICIVVQGADPYELDELESSNLIKLTKEQMLKRDILVFDFLKKNNIPQSYVMAGGYGLHSWEIYFQFLKFVWKSSS